MATGGAPEPEEETVVLPHWVVLDRKGNTLYHNSLEAARVAVDKDKTAAPVDMDGGPSCYVAFTLAAPQKGISCLNLHLPEGPPIALDTPPAYAFLRATVHGALVIRPRDGTGSYPFPKPHMEIPSIIGSIVRE